jgi:hypothetical protein
VITACSATRNAGGDSVIGPDDDVICYGGARPTDTHLLADIVAVDDEIADFLDALAAAPLSFTDAQLDMVCTAAAELPVERRDGLLRAIAASLLTWPPRDDELRDAIAAALGSAE